MGGGRTPVVEPAPSGRERVERAAYDLFSRHGVRSIGVDAVIAEAGVAKMTLYRNFSSKDELILAFLRRHEQRWTRDWLRAEVERRTDEPAQRLLTVFDLLDEWFRDPDFGGCAFITTMIEHTDRSSLVRQAAVGYLAEIRSLLRELAGAAGIADPDRFARQWQILMKGAIVTAAEGDTDAAGQARELAVLLLRRHGLPA